MLKNRMYSANGAGGEVDDSDLMAIIHDHCSRKARFGSIAGADFGAVGYNPVCGDRYAIYIKVDEDRIADVRFEGFGCALSRASASMMAEELVGLAPADAQKVIGSVHAVLVGGGELPPDVSAEIEALTAVRQSPGRIKCVTLAWHAARTALRGERDATTE